MRDWRDLAWRPTAIAGVAGAVDGLIERHDANHPGSKLLFGASPLLLYRFAVAAAGTIMVGFTEIDDEVATTLMVAGGYAVSSSLGSRLVRGGQPLVSGAGQLAGGHAAPVADPGYVTADGRFIQGPIPQGRPGVPWRAAGLITPPASLRGYGTGQAAGLIA